jgi:hypothetical protein
VSPSLAIEVESLRLEAERLRQMIALSREDKESSQTVVQPPAAESADMFGLEVLVDIVPVVVKSMPRMVTLEALIGMTVEEGALIDQWEWTPAAAVKVLNTAKTKFGNMPVTVLVDSRSHYADQFINLAGFVADRMLRGR